MLKIRLIPVLFLRDGYLVRSESFSLYQNIGNPIAQVERYNDWDVDELIYIDISQTGIHASQRADLGGMKGERPEHINDIIRVVASRCFMPLTFGGQIRSLEDMRCRFQLGADKVTINTKPLQDPGFVEIAAREFGSQAIVVSIDVRRKKNGGHEVFFHNGRFGTGLDPAKWAHEVQERGAGEILLNSVDNDGKACGYDIDLIRSVRYATRIPVIACGGAGTYNHFVTAVVEGGATAIAAGNIFHFKELAYPIAKRTLRRLGMNVR